MVDDHQLGLAVGGIVGFALVEVILSLPPDEAGGDHACQAADDDNQYDGCCGRIGTPPVSPGVGTSSARNSVNCVNWFLIKLRF